MSTPHRLPIRVYYEDTDFSGLVYHASYLRFMERARTELLRDLGLNQGALSANADAILFVVRAMTVDFHRPATMDDLLVVETDVVAVGAATLALEQRILRDSARLIAAKVTIAAVDQGRARRLPAEIRAKFQRIARAQED